MSKAEPLITALEALAIIYAEPRAHAPLARSLSMKGAQVRGWPERIKLPCVVTPSSVCYRERDCLAFQAAMTAAKQFVWDKNVNADSVAIVRGILQGAVAGERTGSPATDAVNSENRRRAAAPVNVRPLTLRRCKPEEIGTYNGLTFKADAGKRKNGEEKKPMPGRQPHGGRDGAVDTDDSVAGWSEGPNTA